MRRLLAASLVASASLVTMLSCSDEDDDGEMVGLGGGSGDAGAVLDGGDAGLDGGDASMSTGLEPCDDLDGLGDCGGDTRAAQTRNVNILLVMDKSGSMADTPSGFSTDKWSALKTSLQTALNEVKEAGTISFGLQLFPFPDDASQTIPRECGNDCCQTPSGSDMNVAVADAAETVPQIIEVLDNRNPGGGTPVSAALERAHDYFQGQVLEGDNFVLLATDGGPNCNPDITCTGGTCTLNIEGRCDIDNCCEDNPSGCLDDQAVLDAINALASDGIQTIVVGIPGSEAYASSLDEFATAGGVPNPDSSPDSPEYYEVAASGGVQALTTTFQSITRRLIRSCNIPLEEEPPDTQQVNVAIDCTVVPKSSDAGDAGSGWHFVDPDTADTIRIDGPACDVIEGSGVERLDVVFGCPTVF